MNRGILYTAASGILYGSIGFFGSKLMADGFSVSGLLLWRFLASSLMLAPLAAYFLLRDRKQTNFKILVQLMLLGAIFYGGGTAFYFEGSKTIGTGLAMVIFFAYPIFVVLLSLFVNKTRLGALTLLSLLLIVIGCFCIAIGEEFEIDVYGIGLAILSGLGYGIYVFFTKNVSRSVSPIVATFSVCFGGALAFAGACFLTQGSLPIPQHQEAWLLVILFSFFGTVLPVMLMLLGLKYISANKASIISVLEPVTTLAVGAIVLGETVTGIQFAGAIIILCSAIFVQLEKEESVSDI